MTPTLVLHAEVEGRRRRRRTPLAIVRETVCGLNGHDYVRGAAHNRLFLRCVDCGHETPGWVVDGSQPGRLGR